MSIVIQVFVVLVCLIFLAYIARQVGNERFLLKYALIWLVMAVLILICAIFPEPIFALASLLGFDAPSNFIYFVGIFFLISICLSLTAIVSKQTLKLKNLTQTLAFLDYQEKLDVDSAETVDVDESASVSEGDASS